MDLFGRRHGRSQLSQRRDPVIMDVSDRHMRAAGKQMAGDRAAHVAGALHRHSHTVQATVESGLG